MGETANSSRMVTGGPIIDRRAPKDQYRIIKRSGWDEEDIEILVDLSSYCDAIKSAKALRRVAGLEPEEQGIAFRFIIYDDLGRVVRCF